MQVQSLQLRLNHSWWVTADSASRWLVSLTMRTEPDLRALRVCRGGVSEHELDLMLRGLSEARERNLRAARIEA